MWFLSKKGNMNLLKENKWTKAVLNTYIIFWFVRHGEESFLGNKFLFSNSDI